MKKPTKKEQKPKDVRKPFSFQWEGVEHKEGDRYKVVLPQVGSEEEVELSPGSYYYGFPDNFISLSFSWVNWCAIAITINRSQGEATLKWWQKDMCRREDGLFHFERSQNNPYRQAGHPREIWCIPVEIKAGLIYPKGIPVTPTPPSSIETTVELQAGAQLALF